MSRKKPSLLPDDQQAPLTSQPPKAQGPDKLQAAMAQLARRATPAQVPATHPPAEPQPTDDPHRSTYVQRNTYINIGSPGGREDIDTSTYIEDSPQDYALQLATVGITDQDDLQDLVKLTADKGWTEKQMLFLDHYFQGMELHKAVKAAGYKGKTKSSLCTIGAQILERLETRMDHRQIWRRMGLGEARLASILLAFLQDPAKGVRMEALKLATKAMGLLRDVVEDGRGAQIIIMGENDVPQSPHEYLGEGERGPVKPIRITK